MPFRTYALQHHRPIMLRNAISKPEIFDSNCPVVIHDFLNHVCLFEMLPNSLYDWQPHVLLQNRTDSTSP